MTIVLRRHMFKPADFVPMFPELQDRLDSVSKRVSGFVECRWQAVAGGVRNVLHPDFCVLEVVVLEGEQNILYMTRLPQFWGLAKPRGRHVVYDPSLTTGDYATRPVHQLEYEEILRRCHREHEAETTLRALFESSDNEQERPILITNYSRRPSLLTSVLAQIPWRLVVDFDIPPAPANASDSGTASSADRDAAAHAVDTDGSLLGMASDENARSHSCNITTLSCSNGVLPDGDLYKLKWENSVFWVRALGPDTDRTLTPEEWETTL